MFLLIYVNAGTKVPNEATIFLVLSISFTSVSNEANLKVISGYNSNNFIVHGFLISSDNI